MSEFQLDRNDNGKSINLRLGDSVRVSLPENPSTGYGWKFASVVEPAVRLQSTEYLAGDGTGFGGGGIRNFIFQASEPGHAEIRLELKRPWDSGEPKDSFIVNIRVESD